MGNERCLAMPRVRTTADGWIVECYVQQDAK